MKNKKPEMVVCPTCQGKCGFPGNEGEGGEMCIDCSGTGKVAINTGKMSTCWKCNGTGKVSPPEPVKSEEGLIILRQIYDAGHSNDFLFGEEIDKYLKAQLAKLQPELDRREVEIKRLKTALILKEQGIGEILLQYREDRGGFEARIKELERQIYDMASGKVVEEAIAQAKAEERKAIGELLWNWRVTEGQGWVELLNIITQLKSGLPLEGGK